MTGSDGPAYAVKVISSKGRLRPGPPSAVHLSLRATLAFTILTPMVTISCSPPSSPPPPGAPVITCPADGQSGVVQAPAAAEYPASQPTGGTAPLPVSCAPPSGPEFPVVSTYITCAATDSAARTAECAFRSITFNVIPVLRGTTVVAFGDSITAGVLSPAAPAPPAPRMLDPSSSYPSVLEQQLQERYTSQDIVIINEGVPGEQAVGSDPISSGVWRIERVALQHRPDVLVILEGVNGLDVGNAEMTSEGLRWGVRRAQAVGVPLVIVSTILPGVDGRPKAPDAEAVSILNDKIRHWATIEGALLVDAFAAFYPERERLIGQDGLHPTAEGYVRLAELFRDVLRHNFEEPATSSPPAASNRIWSAGWR